MLDLKYKKIASVILSLIYAYGLYFTLKVAQTGHGGTQFCALPFN